MTFVPVFLVAALVSQAKIAELEPYVSKEGAFSVGLPGKPAVGSREISTALGKITMYSYLVDVGPNAFAVLYSDYPDAMLKAEPDKVLDGARDGAVGGLKGKLRGSKRIKLEDVPGIEFEYELDQPAAPKLVGRCRIFLDKKRMYQVTAVGVEEVAKSEKATRMLDSFKIVKPAK